MERIRMRLWTGGRTDGGHVDRYIPRTYRSEDNKTETPIFLSVLCSFYYTAAGVSAMWRPIVVYLKMEFCSCIL